MNKFIDILFRFFAPPAFVLDIYSIVVQNINIWLLIGLSAISIFAAVVSIKKNRAEKKAFEAQQKFYELQCDQINCPNREKCDNPC